MRRKASNCHAYYIGKSLGIDPGIVKQQKLKFLQKQKKVDSDNYRINLLLFLIF